MSTPSAGVLGTDPSTGGDGGGVRRWVPYVWPALLLAIGLLARGAVADVMTLIALGWTVAWVIVGVRYRDPARPRPPSRRTAPLPRVRLEPPRTVPMIATHCVICGRPLSNRQSMLARVGSTCIRTYGPRPAWQHNVDHDLWTEEWARARADQIDAQVRLDGEFERAMAQLPRLMEAWEDELASATGTQRRARRQRAVGVLWSALGWLAVIGLLL